MTLVYPLGTFDGWNDDASAVHVPEGMAVRLFQHVNYIGNALGLNSWARILTDYPCGCGGDGTWNDQASSISYNGVLLFNNAQYNDPNYTPPSYPTNNYASQEFFTGNADYLPNNYIGNDTVTSLVVGRGWQVTLYQHAWYTGNSLVLGEGNYPNLQAFYCGCGGDGTWNDQVSSVQVYWIGP